MRNFKKLLPITLFIIILLSVSNLYGQAVNRQYVRFAYLADIHISDVASNIEDLEISVADINTLKDIDFVVFAGDITEFGSDKEIEIAKSIISRLNVPYYVLSGNHDSKWSESGCNTFAKVFGYEYFSFKKNGIQFIGTNSGPNMRMAPALVPREAMVWLDSVTRSLPREMPVVFINHYPLDDAMLNFADVIDMLKRVNIQVSLCGHGHSNRALDFSGVRGVMGRSNLRAGKVAAGHAGYNIVTIDTHSEYSFGKISFAVRSNGITQEPWHSIPLLKHSANPVMHAPVDVVWEFQDDSDIGSAAAFAFGHVYISNTAGVIKSLDAADGSLKWSFATGGKVFSSPEVCEKSAILVVGSSDNFIYGLDAHSGKLLWKVEAAKSVLGSPSMLGDLVYIGASDGVFRAINIKSGRVVWSYTGIKSFIEAKPWADADGVYIGDWANRVYAFEPKSGKLMWEWTNRKGRGLSAAAVWPVKANGKLFVVTPERRSHAIDALTGKELWSARGGREAIGLSQDGSAVYIKTMQDTVIAFSTGDYNIAATSTGSANTSGNTPIKLWESHTGYGYEIAPSPMTTANGLIFVPTDKGNIFALNATDGTVAWKYRFSIALINYIRPIGNRQLLVTSMDGKVAILSY
ncbi:MAG: metallophosphoesterase [Bacteroidetes bacterium HGW-Bacteroidetes-7]|jgi:outer membrane protein assembly factor BamB/Icc-related predicted phosphoesterase|nr:MAG: metallophosphoesterase [Bacteroidetes bacterium HGW-Bacteroidetes-7]